MYINIGIAVPPELGIAVPPELGIAVPPELTVAQESVRFLVNVFFTIRSQNRDLAAIPAGNYSYGRPASLLFRPKSGK